MSNSSAGPVVGVVGVGTIGAGMADGLLRAGYDLAVYDTRSEATDRFVAAGCQLMPDLQGVARVGDVIFVVVIDDEQVHHVFDDLLETARPGTVIVISSTVLPGTCIELAERAALRDVAVVDAPVSGGGGGEKAGGLSLIIGGDDDTVRSVWTILEAVASHLFHLGPIGAGSAGKLVNNLLSLGTYLIQLEAMQLAAAYGIDEDAATSFLCFSGGDSKGIRSWGRLDRIRSETKTDSGIPRMYALASKDVRAAATAAGVRSVVLPLAAVMGELLEPKMAERDRLIKERGLSSVPRCTVCSQELAAPFRAVGTHPECRENSRPNNVGAEAASAHGLHPYER